MTNCPTCGAETPEDAVFCPKCGGAVDGLSEIETLKKKANWLKKQLVSTEEELESIRNVVDTNADLLGDVMKRLDSSQVFSPNFSARATAIWGHAVLMNIAVGVVLWLIVLAFTAGRS